ncbi:hypothetical protein PV05_09485 [Exophiala xenobiotica]|uniref:Uncharacterized protein n=1 Tax=Exophiala xenobiotica TaxID=348802 RepID=A0A0D2CLF6_9EURO|nr:uncharacterized protein PV05_09485 [Exophiala xenobiotica]KIW50697.1 hypothetical protein PV05_09485 [Exophiala xenobiotica]
MHILRIAETGYCHGVQLHLTVTALDRHWEDRTSIPTSQCHWACPSDRITAIVVFPSAHDQVETKACKTPFNRDVLHALNLLPGSTMAASARADDRDEASTKHSKRAHNEAAEEPLSSDVPSTKKSKQKASKPGGDETGGLVRATHFGIELELVLVFREDQLKAVLSDHNIDADIVKRFTSNDHANLLAIDPMQPAYDVRHRYPSFALHVTADDIICNRSLHLGMFVNKVSGDRRWLRRYVMEPLLVARKCLSAAKLDSNVIGWISLDPQYPRDPTKAEIQFPKEGEDTMIRKGLVDYTEWTLTNDHTLVGALRGQMLDSLSSKGLQVDQISNWDSTGVELISPIFELEHKDDAFAQIQQYLAALNGKDVLVMESVWASTHVHVGFNFDKPEDMPILLLQHLAYILVLHEDLLSKCHPRSRCGAKPPSPQADVGDLSNEQSDFDDFDDFDPDAPLPPRSPSPTEEELEKENEKKVLDREAQYTGFGNVESNAEYLRTQVLHNITARNQPRVIRDSIFKEGGSIFDLVKLLQKPDPKDENHRYRGYMYNFANLWTLAKNETPWKPIKPTLEFRQHACTTDVNVIRHWVTLLEAIARTAERKAASTKQHSGILLDATRTYAEREASKYPSASWPFESMSEFSVRLLDLDADEGLYWQDRYERYKDDRPSKEGSGI